MNFAKIFIAFVVFVWLFLFWDWHSQSRSQWNTECKQSQKGFYCELWAGSYDPKCYLTPDEIQRNLGAIGRPRKSGCDLHHFFHGFIQPEERNSASDTPIQADENFEKAEPTTSQETSIPRFSDPTPAPEKPITNTVTNLAFPNVTACSKYRSVESQNEKVFEEAKALKAAKEAEEFSAMTDKEKEDHSWNNILNPKKSTYRVSTQEERNLFIACAEENQRRADSFCGSIKNISIGLAEEMGRDLRASPNQLSFSRAYSPSSQSSTLSCRVVIYHPRGVVDCSIPEWVVKSGVITSIPNPQFSCN